MSRKRRQSDVEEGVTVAEVDPPLRPLPSSPSSSLPPSALPDHHHLAPDDSCPVCKSDPFINPGMRLLVSPCYHRLCETCVERLFAHGTGSCPVCHCSLRRTNWAPASFEDLRVEREVRIRKRILAIFNQTQEDFTDTRAYNDYLEEVEEIIFKLVNEEDVQATNERLEAYRVANREQIARRRERAAIEEAQLAQAQAAEAQRRQDYEMSLLAELEAEEEARQSSETRFIEELSRGVRPRRREKGPSPTMMMPSFRGLVSADGVLTSADTVAFDPLEGLPPIKHAFLTTSMSTESATFVECWFTPSRPIPSPQVLAAGGVRPAEICNQLLLTLCTY